MGNDYTKNVIKKNIVCLTNYNILHLTKNEQTKAWEKYRLACAGQTNIKIQ